MFESIPPQHFPVIVQTFAVFCLGSSLLAIVLAAVAFDRTDKSKEVVDSRFKKVWKVMSELKSLTNHQDSRLDKTVKELKKLEDDTTNNFLAMDQRVTKIQYPTPVQQKKTTKKKVVKKKETKKKATKKKATRRTSK